jgi:transketolase
MELAFGPRRGTYIDVRQEIEKGGNPLSLDEVRYFETFDSLYRSLCAILYNYAPLSGHPGGSISSGRFVAGIIFDALDYDVSAPNRPDADILSYAAGHKAMGLYALWALRNEVMRLGAPELLPADEALQLRLEDLLGFRRNPVTSTPLFVKFRAKALDGHPTPATPFVLLSTGASGVGVASSLGLAFGAMGYYGASAPRVHIVEGEGGMTPGRVSESLAAAGTASLKNAVLHVDWNQASIDSNAVCRDGDTPGDYVQWTPAELAYLHDWNVILVPDGKDFQQVIAAQRMAAQINNSQPTAIVYRTTKGWQYGIEGKKSHGAGHSLCSEGFYQAVKPLLDKTGSDFPRCNDDERRCRDCMSEVIEECFWSALTVVRQTLEDDLPTVHALAQKLVEARERLDRKERKPRPEVPSINAIYEIAQSKADSVPPELVLTPGKTTTLRGTLGSVLRYYNKASQGAIFSASADLLGSTSVSVIGQDFAEGYFNAATNPDSRILSIGGICEDAMSGVMAGLSAYGHHIGVCSSYGAFIAALGHIASRLHSIGNEARQALTKEDFKPFILVCAHAGIKTGEDGPTHADPQPLQLIQENFPRGTVITLTPWDPQEIWTLISAALAKRPAVICPFVTRPNETILDRQALDLSPATEAASGVYLLHRSKQNRRGTLVLQGSEVAYAFAEQALPLLLKNGLDIDAYYVASAELFDLLPEDEQDRIFPEERAQEAMGITGFTLPTLYRWIQSDYGRKMSLHPFGKGHYLGSGKADMVMKEAGLDGESQFKAILRYLENLEK